MPADAEAPAETAWWEVADGRLVAQGHDSGWLPRSPDRAAEPVTIIGLVGADAVRTERRDPASLATAQARTAARLEAEGGALGSDPHAATSAAGWIAVTDAARMQAWLAWAEVQGIGLDHIVPAACLLPRDGGWHAARFGSHALLARDGVALPDDEALVAALVGDAPFGRVAPDALDNAIAGLASALPVDLRQGRFARARRWAPDPRRLREFALLLLFIMLAALAIPIAKAVKWEAQARALDRDTAALATAALGRPVEATAAETELRAALGSGAAGTNAAQMVASLFAAMQSAPSVEATMIDWGAGGRLDARLVAGDAGALNAVLLMLQQRGWSVTATPVAGGDGRAAIDLSMRGAS
nr:type II secretion system protein GspL [Sphingomicrobium astaxanthinifaciens]